MNESLPHAHPPRFTIGRILRTLLADIFYLPRWHQIVLSLGLLAAVAGWFGVFSHAAKPAPQSSSAVATNPASPTAESPAAPTPWVSRAGASLVIGFIVGWLFRTFTKFMALIAAAFAAVMGALSYCHVLNADMTAAATQEYHTASTWLSSQAGKLKDAALAHVPSTTTAAFGVFLGARKKRRVV